MANFDNIIQEINTNIPDNNTQAITAAKLRTTLIDLTNTIDTNESTFEETINGTINEFINTYNPTNVIDSLDSDSSTDALSANQGKVLKTELDEITQLYDVTEYPINFALLSGYYYNTRGNLVQANNSLYTEEISLSPEYNFVEVKWDNANSGSGRSVVFKNDLGVVKAVYQEKNYITSDGGFYIKVQKTSEMTKLYISSIGSATNHSAIGIVNILNENSIPALELEINKFKDNYNVLGMIDEPNIYQSIYELSSNKNLYQLEKEKLVTQLSGLYDDFTNVDFTGFPVKNVLYDGARFIVELTDAPVFEAKVYVSPDGTGDGTSEDTPTNLATALLSLDNKELILEPGIYYTEQINLQNKNASIKCNYGKATICALKDTLSFTSVNGIWRTSYTYDIAKIFTVINGEYVMYKKETSFEDCLSNNLSYYIDETNHYLFINGDKDNVLVTQKMSTSGKPLVYAASTTSGVRTNVLLENLDLVGGYNIVSCNTRVDVRLKNCTLVGNYNTTGVSNCLTVTNQSADSTSYCTSIAENCVCKYSSGDGFNYHQHTKFVEINCVSGVMGYDIDGFTEETNSQGSTAHNYCIGIRINGVYYDAKVSCVADVNSAVSVNVNCTAIQRIDFTEGKNGFLASENTVMYLFGCSTLGCTYGAKTSQATATIYSRYCDIDGTDQSTPF